MENLPTKSQLISLDSSQRTSGTVDNCVFDLRAQESKYFLENFKDVVAIRLVDYHVATLRGNVYTGGYVIDIEIDEIPTRAQILDQELGQVFARVPIDRVDSTTDADVETRDQYWKQHHIQPQLNYFNPISLNKLSIKQTQLGGFARERFPLQTNAGWYMILEVITLDHEAPKPKTNDNLHEAIQELSRVLEKGLVPVTGDRSTEPNKKIPLWKLGLPVGIILVMVMYFYSIKRRPPV